MSSLASKYLDNIRKSECKRFDLKKLSKEMQDWYAVKGNPIAYVTGKGDKFAGTIHYSKKIGYYWMAAKSSNCYLINKDGSLGTDVTHIRK